MLETNGRPRIGGILCRRGSLKNRALKLRQEVTNRGGDGILANLAPFFMVNPGPGGSLENLWDPPFRPVYI